MLFLINLGIIWCVRHEDEVLGGGDGPALVQHDPNSEEEVEQEPGPVAFVSKATMGNTTEQLIQTLDHKNRLIETLCYGLECVEYDKVIFAFHSQL